MLDALRKLLQSAAATPTAAPAQSSAIPADDVRVAACALLIELASVDGDFSDAEQAQIRWILERHFGVTGEGVDALMADAAAAARSSVDDFTFTRRVVQAYDLPQRMVLAELMWQVVLADGQLAERESYLMRKLANLLQLEPAYLAEARRKTER